MSFSSKPIAAGFTLLELLVVIAIMLFITTIILGRLNGFRSQTALDLVAQEVAIDVRGAQVFGIGTRQYGTEFPRHGISFDREKPQTFYLFADTNSSSNDIEFMFDEGSGCASSADLDLATTECREAYTLDRNIIISDLCVVPAGSDDCVSVERLDVTYKRPHTEAKIVIGDGDDGYTEARVTLARGQNPMTMDEYRFIRIFTNGHIAVERPDQEPTVRP